MEVVEVKFDYVAEQADELTLRVGDIIKNCRLVEDGWMEGELNGKRGIFPDNFVAKAEITPPPAQTVEHVPMRNRGSTKQRRAKARFSYHPQAEDELELADGDEVLVLEIVEEGWWKGRIGQKEGVFPSNFVEEITEEEPPPSSTSSSHNDKPTPAPQPETVDHTPVPNRASGIMMPAMKGLDPANLRANLRKTPQTDVAKKPPPPNTSPKVPSKPPVTHAPPPPTTTTNAASAKKMAKVMFDYDATHVDELTIKVDDVVEVIGDDEPGWIKVKLGDKTGIIPDNFIEVIKKETPKVPTPPLPTREEPPPAGRLPPPEKKEEPVKKAPFGVPLPGASSLQRHPPPVAVKKPMSKPPPVAGPRPTRPVPPGASHNSHDSIDTKLNKFKAQDDKERSLDLDTVPKTEKLDNQVVSTRPKMSHNPPSRSHIHKGSDDKEPKQDDSDNMPPWKRELQQKRREPRPQPVPPSKPVQPLVQPSVQPSEPPPPAAAKPEAPVNTAPISTNTTAPASTGVSDAVVKQIKDELDSLKKEIESLKPLKKELELLKSDYKKDVEILTQDLDEERKKVAGLQVEIDRLKKTKGFR